MYGTCLTMAIVNSFIIFIDELKRNLQITKYLVNRNHISEQSYRVISMHIV